MANNLREEIARHLQADFRIDRKRARQTAETICDLVEQQVVTLEKGEKFTPLRLSMDLSDLPERKLTESAEHVVLEKSGAVNALALGTAIETYVRLQPKGQAPIGQIAAVFCTAPATIAAALKDHPLAEAEIADSLEAATVSFRKA